MRHITVALLALVCVTIAQAQTVVNQAVIVEHGLYSVERAKTIPDSNEASGTRFEAASTVLTNSTTDVPAQVGVSFGYRLRLVGTPQGAPVTLTLVTKMPSVGLINPDTKEIIYRTTNKMTMNIGDIAWVGYNFDGENETVPGPWTFEVWLGTTKLAEQKFTVVKR